MSAKELEPIATRTLKLRSGREAEVTVVIYKPSYCEGPGDFRCDYSIAGNGINVRRYAAGLDSVQALQMVFIHIGAHLDRYEMTSGSRLDWAGSDHGFPREAIDP